MRTHHPEKKTGERQKDMVLAYIKKRMIEVPKRRTAGTARVAEYYLEQPKAAPTEQMGLLA